MERIEGFVSYKQGLCDLLKKKLDVLKSTKESVRKEVWRNWLFLFSKSMLHDRALHDAKKSHEVARIVAKNFLKHFVCFLWQARESPTNGKLAVMEKQDVKVSELKKQIVYEWNQVFKVEFVEGIDERTKRCAFQSLFIIKTKCKTNE
jgi:hypothetical protein